MKTCMVVLAVVLLLGSCAWVEVRPLTTAERKNESEPDKAAELNGIRFYRPSPHLFVRQTNGGACDATVVYYPDADQPYIIRPHRGIGSITYTPTLTDGWNLTGFTGTVDSKVPEMISGLASAATAMKGLVVTEGGDHVVFDISDLKANDNLGPGLYKMIFAEKGAVALKRVFAVKGSNGRFKACSGLSSLPAK